MNPFWIGSIWHIVTHHRSLLGLPGEGCECSAFAPAFLHSAALWPCGFVPRGFNIELEYDADWTNKAEGETWSHLLYLFSFWTFLSFIATRVKVDVTGSRRSFEASSSKPVITVLFGLNPKWQACTSTFSVERLHSMQLSKKEVVFPNFKIGTFWTRQWDAKDLPGLSRFSAYVLWWQWRQHCSIQWLPWMGGETIALERFYSYI